MLIDRVKRRQALKVCRPARGASGKVIFQRDGFGAFFQAEVAQNPAQRIGPSKVNAGVMLRHRVALFDKLPLVAGKMQLQLRRPLYQHGLCGAWGAPAMVHEGLAEGLEEPGLAGAAVHTVEGGCFRSPGISAKVSCHVTRTLPRYTRTFW